MFPAQRVRVFAQANKTQLGGGVQAVVMAVIGLIKAQMSKA
jgi:hypothetical protein